MSELSKEELGLVAGNPLGDALDQVRDALNKAEDANSNDMAAPARPKLYADVMDRLLGILSASKAAVLLASRTGGNSLAADLVLVRSQIAKGKFEYKHFSPLSRLIINKAPDTDIWKTVTTLVRTLSPSTPPPMAPPSSQDTPITISSASHGSEQRRQYVNDRLLQELGGRTYRGIDGFHEKYFETWRTLAARLWIQMTASGLYNGKRWKNLPDKPTEDQVYGWWFGLQKHLPKRSQRTYFKSTLSNMVETNGRETKRQIDLFVKDRKLPASTHQWKDIVAMGELKKSKHDWQGTFLQTAGYVREVFAHQPTRKFVHAFTLCGFELETWVFDRSGAYSGPVINIHAEPKKFLEVFCGYVMMDSEQLGLDALIETKGQSQFVTLPVPGTRRRKIKLELDPVPIASRSVIAGRGTTCYRAKAKTPTDKFKSAIIKVSWVQAERTSEADFLQTAHERGREAKLVGNRDVTAIADLRKGLRFPAPYQFRSRAPSAVSSQSQAQLASQTAGQVRKPSFPGKRKLAALSGAETRNAKRPRLAEPTPGQDDDYPFDNRIMRVLAITPEGRPVEQFTTERELLMGLRSAGNDHRFLYIKCGILHRDVSVNNIILTEFGGMLIDLDLARYQNKGPSGAWDRTGTLESMAIEVLEGAEHTHRHDLESLFYSTICLCVRRGTQPRHSLLTHWYTGTMEDISRIKRGDMLPTNFERILAQFPSGFKQSKRLCMKLRGILFPTLRNGDLFTGTPEDPNKLYDQIIGAFDEAIASC